MEGGDSRGDRMTTPAYLAELESLNADCLTVIDGMIEEMKRLKKVVAENQKLVRVLIDGARTGAKEKTK